MIEDWVAPADESVVVLEGEMLGSFTTDDGKRDRWVEMQLVGTDNGYLVYGVGKSRVPGEIDRPWIKWWPEAFLVLRALLSVPLGRQESTTVPALRMLQHAARLDEDIATALARWRG